MTISEKVIKTSDSIPTKHKPREKRPQSTEMADTADKKPPHRFLFARFRQNIEINA